MSRRRQKSATKPKIAPRGRTKKRAANQTLLSAINLLLAVIIGICIPLYIEHRNEELQQQLINMQQQSNIAHLVVRPSCEPPQCFYRAQFLGYPNKAFGSFEALSFETRPADILPNNPFTWPFYADNRSFEIINFGPATARNITCILLIPISGTIENQQDFAHLFTITTSPSGLPVRAEVQGVQTLEDPQGRQSYAINLIVDNLEKGEILQVDLIPNQSLLRQYIIQREGPNQPLEAKAIKAVFSQDVALVQIVPHVPDSTLMANIWHTGSFQLGIASVCDNCTGSARSIHLSLPYWAVYPLAMAYTDWAK